MEPFVYIVVCIIVIISLTLLVTAWKIDRCSVVFMHLSEQLIGITLYVCLCVWSLFTITATAGSVCVYRLFNITTNDISFIYAMAHRCAGGLKK